MPRAAKGPYLVFRENRGKWYIRDEKGRWYGTGAVEADRAGADLALADFIASRHKPEFRDGDPDHVQVVDVLAHYLEHHVPTLRRPDVERSAVLHLGEFFEERMCGAIGPSLCKAYVTWRTAQPQARYKDPEKAPRVGMQTARRELEVLSAALGYCYEERRLRYPVPVRLPDKAPPRERWLTRREVAALLLSCMGWVKGQNGRWARTGQRNPHIARFVLVGVYTGTRHDAILKLRWMPSTEGGWIDLDGMVLYRKGVREGQSSKRRTPVAISARLAAHLRRWKAQGGSYVVEYEGAPIGKAKRAWKTARKAAGLGEDVTPHILRHTFGAWAVLAKQPLDEVAEALGTTKAMVKLVYGHLQPEYTRDAVEAVARRRRR